MEQSLGYAHHRPSLVDVHLSDEEWYGAMLGRVLANQDPDSRRKVLQELLAAACGLQLDYNNCVRDSVSFRSAHPSRPIK